METVSISKENAIKAYRNADAGQKQLLSNLLGNQINFSGKITDRIKTFEDACIETGENATDEKFSVGTPDEIAFKKLKVIVKALNEGVVLSFANSNQYKYYPYFKYEGSGFRFFVAGYGYSYAYACGGSRLCVHSEELAKYLGSQFIDLYNQLLK